MQIQALMFFVLSATVLSRSVAPYPRSLNARAAMGIMSHSPRLASRSIVRRAGANTPGDPPEVPNAEDPSANNDPKAQGDDKSKPDDGNKADALKSEDDKKQADAKKTEDDKKNNDPSKPDSTENDAAKGDQNDPNQVADNDPSKKHDGDQDGKGIKRNAKGLIPDTKEGIEFKIATEKKKLHELSEKTKEKDARIAELEQRLSQLDGGGDTKDPTKKAPGGDADDENGKGSDNGSTKAAAGKEANKAAGGQAKKDSKQEDPTHKEASGDNSNNDGKKHSSEDEEDSSEPKVCPADPPTGKQNGLPHPQGNQPTPPPAALPKGPQAVPPTTPPPA